MMMKRGMVDKHGESMVASYRYLGVSNPGLQMLGSNECDVSSQYGTRASFQYTRIPAHYILRPKKNLRQLESCQLLRMNEAWMDECAARLHQTFTIEKILRFDCNNPIISWGQKNLFKKR